MKKNYSRGCTSIISGFKSDKFEVVDEFLKNYNLKECLVVGLLGHDSKFGRSYSLAIEHKSGDFFLNIPKYLGEDIEADFLAEGKTPEEYFNCHIKAITEITTKNGNTYEFEFTD